MMIPSIDLMAGQAVQLRQGKDHVLTSDRCPIELAREFNRYGPVAVIDLDAALGQGDNLPLIRQLCKVATVRAGGGIRSKERGHALLRAGAERIIIGTAATPEFLGVFPAERVMVALDHRQGEVVDHGWTQSTGESLQDRADRLAPYCSSFLCTFVEAEGTLKGMDLKAALTLQSSLPHPITVAGGIATTAEVVALSQAGLDVQVGMALYTGKLDPISAVVESLDFMKAPLMPTIVQDEAGQVLMLAYSTPASLTEALQKGRGIYYSRSREAIWEKGKTSGHTQDLLACRPDCDRDSLLFQVRQKGPACHTDAYSCFGKDQRQKAFSMVKLFDTLKDRQRHLPEASYTTTLFQDPKRLTRKVMEEAFEVATAPDRDNRIWEIADLLYFLSVVAVSDGIDWSDIEAELGGRHS